jgi:hypothetical protein
MNVTSKAKEVGRPYAGALLYRPLCRTDCVDPDSGKTERIALVLLEEDDEG